VKIAVACTGGSQTSAHFGRSERFVVFEVRDGRVAGREVRDNAWTAHARGEAGEHDAGRPHDHSGVVAALGDCRAVIAAGMGFRAAEALAAAGVAPLVLAGPCSADEAVALFLAGGLAPGTSRFCRCDHHDHQAGR
jgi:predicted Fe-Mo cluster-binding NifX family protein